MSASVVSFLALLCLLLAYRFYARYLARNLYHFDIADEDMPSSSLSDGVDFVPTKKHVLLGHHFSSIAGAAPILGPAIAIIWGWVPAIIWIVLGSIFIGAVHDYGALVLSVLFKGRSIGSITGEVIGRKSKRLFLTIIFLLVFIVIAVFAYIIANLFVLYPGSVIPVNFEIIVAIVIGRMSQKKGISLLIPSIVALIVLYAMIYLGHLFPISIDPSYALNGSPAFTWVLILLVYGYIAAILPVQILLQPRDLINAHQLILGLVLIYVGMFVSSPEIVAPAINTKEISINWFPYLFVTIACGAVSGFHGLVSSGTSSKQLMRLRDAKSIGYGSMLGEASLAIVATMAVASGFENADQWMHHYHSFEGAQGLQSKLQAFVSGTTLFIQPFTDLLNMPAQSAQSLGAVFISVLVISFAATSLDTSVRIQRYVVGELLKPFYDKKGENRYITTAIAVLCSLILVLTDGSGSGGLRLWPLFGTTNQLLACLTLMVITIFLKIKGKRFIYTLIPLLVLMLIVSISALSNLLLYLKQGNYLLLVIDFVILTCFIWLVWEGVIFAKKWARDPRR